MAWTIHSPGRVDAPTRQVASSQHVATTASGDTPVLWVLGVGVSQYQDASLNLQFADTDARAVVGALQRQSNGPLYREVKTELLTNEEATRETILRTLNRFLAQAGPDDVVVIFVAGHGVQDRASGSYYFLPSPATAGNLLTAGLRMSDFDEMVRVVRRTARAVVVILDTCHAGALRLSTPDLVAADDIGGHMSAGEGFFLLAAAKPGEDSNEKPELRHGALTYALLEGLDGAADSDGDGVVSVSDLFGYVAREVPRLTDGAQHPYSKIEGTDLVLAAVQRNARTPPGGGPPLPRQPAAPATLNPAVANTIGVMEFRDLRSDPQNAWIGKAVRVALNTELSKVRALRVYSPDLIDRTAQAGRSDHLAIAQRLGIRTLLSGSYHVVGDTIRIDAEIIDAATGVQEGSDSVQGNLNEFFDLQKKLVLSMLRRLPVELSVQEGQSIQDRTNTSVDAYRLLLQAEGVVDEGAATRPTASPSAAGEPHSALDAWLWRYAARLLPVAYAAEPRPDVEAEVRAFLEEYRRAHEQKDLERLANLYVSFSERQRNALRVYLDNANGLVVEVTDVSIEPREHEVAVSYTRRDRFVDRESGKPTQVEVRLTKVLVRDNGKWRIAGGR